MDDFDEVLGFGLITGVVLGISGFVCLLIYEYFMSCMFLTGGIAVLIYIISEVVNE